MYDNRPKQGPDDRESNFTFLENHIHSLLDLSKMLLDIALTISFQSSFFLCM